ncbi:MAG: hypothetical protein IIW86_00525, partial [Clostridia bacterium]|nr:hypothetical protein [Clostridia bacterium]
MVKGVNKTVIEINETGSKYFERVVFFVSPEYSFMSQNKLETKVIDYMSEGVPSLNFKRVKNVHSKKATARRYYRVCKLPDFT